MSSFRTFFSDAIYRLGSAIQYGFQKVKKAVSALWAWITTPASSRPPLEQFISLDYFQLKALENAEVRQFILAGYITIEQFAALTMDAARAIRNAEVRQFIVAGYITIEQFAALNYFQLKALENAEVRQFIVAERITIEQFIALNIDAVIAIQNAEVRQFIVAGPITIEQFAALNYFLVEALENAEVRQFILAEYITIEQFAALTMDAARAIRNAEVRQFILAGHITIEQFAALYYFQLKALENAEVRQFIVAGPITIEQFAALYYFQLKALENAEVRQFILAGPITIGQFIALNLEAARAIQDAVVRQLIMAGRMTAAQLARINTYEAYLAITVPDTIQRILNRELDVEDIIGGQILDRLAQRRNAYNAVQSTHTASVHEATSESATNLYKRYKDNIQAEKLEEVIGALVKYVSNFSAPVLAKYNNRERNCTPYAKGCIERITAPEFTFVDHASNVSIRQLLAMAYLAINDTAILLGTVADAGRQIIQGLYEIERGYNIDNADISRDDEGVGSNSICVGGTFNKIVEKLVGTHPDCNIVFINKDTVAFRMRAIVLENIAKEIGETGLSENFSSRYPDGDVFTDYDWSGIWDLIKLKVDKDIKACYTSENETIRPEVLGWIQDNMDGFNVPECLLNSTDMKTIKKLLANKPKKQVTPMYTSAVASSTPKIKRSASLGNMRIESTLPRSRCNSI